jgi:phosphatidylserine decarboxylase
MMKTRTLALLNKTRALPWQAARLAGRTALTVLRHEDVNFLLTNRLPRRAATRFMGWFSKIERPWVRRPALWAWQRFGRLPLHEAKQRHFTSVHDCFIRELKPGARPVDPRAQVLVSPCDAIVGAHGRIQGEQVIQAKGFPYRLRELLLDDERAAEYCDGTYVTLRITSTMYHRFHAPHDGTLGDVTYLSGDTWNVNPIALQRVERLFCKNERALMELTLDAGPRVLLVPVAAILVASIRLHAADVLLHLKHRGPNVIPCSARVKKGEELGWFQHGSTILRFAPPGFCIAPGVREGQMIRVGQALMHLPDACVART